MGKSKKPQSGLLQVLFSRTQNEVLGLLLLNPHKEFFMSEIVAKAKCGSGSVQRELERLNMTGLVISHKVGSLRYFKANTECPIYHELQKIFLKTRGAHALISQSLQKLSAQINIAFIFGSTASGLDHAESDIDLLVVGDDLKLEDIYEAIEDAETTLDRKISPILFSSSEFKKKKRINNSFLDKVLRSPYDMLIGDIHDT